MDEEEELFSFSCKLIQSVCVCLIHLLRSGADLHGIGDPASSFLSGDVDDVFESQADLRSKVSGDALRPTKAK